MATDPRRADIERAARAAAERIAEDSTLQGYGYCPAARWMANVIVEEMDKEIARAGLAELEALRAWNADPEVQRVAESLRAWTTTEEHDAD